MNKQDIILGKWWTSNNPSRKITGILNVKKKELFLSDSLNGDDFDEYFNRESYKPRFLQPNDSIFINGIDINSGQGIYSLVFYDNPRTCKQRLTPMGATHCYSYKISQIWGGGFLNNFDDLKSNKFICNINGLSQYTPATYPRLGVGQKKISLSMPNDVKVYSANGIFIYLHTSASYHSQTASSKYEFKNHVGLRITSRRKLPLSEATEYCRKIRNFFSITTNTKLTSGRTAFKRGPGYCHTITGEEYISKISKPLCRYATIKNELDRLLSKWLDVYDQYHIVFDQLSIFIGEKLPIETRFIIFTSIAETYVSLKEPNHNNSLQASLKYLNESLSKEMRVLDKFSTIKIDRIRTTRNKLVHGKLDNDNSQDAIITDIHELLIAGRLIEYLVITDIFKTLGSSNHILEEIRDYYRFYIDISSTRTQPELP